MKKFIENLYYLLECNHISKTQFIKDLRLGKNAISKWESRDTLPNGNTLVAIADYFDVSLDYLIGRSDNCDDTPVPLLSDRHNDLQIELRVKQLGSEWVLDIDAYNKIDEIMTAITGYTEDTVKELKYNGKQMFKAD